MSKTIDERVVEMRFDNRHFESNVKTTMSTLDKLKQKLNLPGASKSLEDVEAAARKVKFTGLSNAVDTVNAKFSALQVMGVTALANITNSAVNAGKRIVSAFTIDPIKTGFSEYETQINAIQTILANTSSKGTTLEDVNKALDTLNTYADKTIYNFTEMTRNIGTFTAAGVDLDTSVSAIQGIANLAAVSGSTSQQASTAMYQLSQALAAGTVKLQDWNSVVNAGMGGQVFQDALKRTATVMGTNVDAMIEKYGSFRESLTKGEWITSDVLTETLKQFTMAAEEGTEQWEEFKRSLKEQGYTEEQAVEILKMANTATDAATKVKTFTQLMDTLKESAQSGWTQTWELLVGDFDGAKNLFGTIYETLSGVINESAEARNSLLKGALSSNWEKLEEQITATGLSFDDFQEKIKETAKEHNIAIDDIIKEEGSLANAFKSGRLSGSLIIETLKKYTSGLTKASTAAEVTTDKIDELRSQVLKTIRGDFGNGADRVKAFADAGMDYAAVQGIVNDCFADGVINYEKLDESLSKMSVSQLQSIGYTEEQAETLKKLAEQAEKTGTPLNELINNLTKPSGKELLIDTIKNALNGFVGTVRIVSSSWSKFLGMDSSGLYNIIEGLNKLSKCLILTDSETGELNETGDKLRRTFEGIFALLDIITTITGGALKTGIKLVCKLFGMTNVDVLDLTANLGDLLVKFHDFIFENNLIAKGLNKLVSGIAFVAKEVGKLISAFLELPQVQRAIEKFKKIVTDTYKDGKDFVLGFINGVKDGTIDIKESVMDLGRKILQFFRKVLRIESPSKETKSDGKYFVQGFIEGVKAFVGKAIEAIKSFAAKSIKAIRDFFSSIDWGAVFAIGSLVMVAYTLRKILGIVESVTNILPDFQSVTEELSKGIKRWSKAKAFSEMSNGLVRIATAVAILTTSLIALTFVNTDKLWEAMGVLGALAGGVVVMGAFIGVIQKFLGSNVSKASISIVALSASILILAVALEKMDGLNVKKLLVTVPTLVILMVSLATAAGLLGKFVPQLSAGSLLLISLATSLNILISSLTALDKLDTGTVMKSIVALPALIGALALMIKACGGVSFSSSAGIVGISIALKILVGTLDDIGAIDTTNILAKIGSFITIFGMFAVLMMSSRFAGKHALKAGVGIIAMSIALQLVVMAFKMMAKVDPADMDKALYAVSQLLLIFGAIVAVSRFAGKHASSAGVMLLAMSGALVILTGVIFLLGKFDPEALKRALTAVTILELVFGGLIAITRIANSTKGMSKMLLTMSISIVILTAAVAALTLLDPTKMFSAVGALSVLLSAFALLVASTKYAKSATKTILLMTGAVVALGGILYLLATLKVGSTLEIAASLSLLLLSLSASILIVGKSKPIYETAYMAVGIMTAVIAGLAIIIGVLASFNVSSTLEIAASLSLLLLSLSASVVILSKTLGVSKSALAAAGIMTAIVAGLAAILGVLASFNVGPTLELSASLSLLLLSLSASCLILAPIGIIGPKALMGVAVLAAVIVAVGGLMAGIAALNKYVTDGELSTLLNEGLPMLEKIGTGLGSFVGGLIGGFAAGIASSLPAIADGLSDFIFRLNPFVAGIRNIDESTVAGVKSLAETVLILSAASFLNGITALFGGKSNFSTFGEGLAEFGSSLDAYGIAVSNLNVTAIEASIPAVKALVEIGKELPNSGGLLGGIMGENDFATFANGLGGFGTKLTAYGASVANLNVDAVMASIPAVEALADVAAKFSNTGGLAAWIMGENDFETFGKGLGGFGTRIAAYGASIANADVNAIVASMPAVEALANVASKFSNTGGLAAWIMGENDFETFGKGLGGFGTRIAAYGIAISAANVDAITASVPAVEALVDIASKFTNSGGLLSWLAGENDFETFGKGLGGFGTRIAAYGAAVSNLNTQAVMNSIPVVEALVDMAENLPSEDGWFSDNMSLTDFGSDINSFGSNLEGYYNHIKSIGTSKMFAVTEGVNNLVKMAKGMKDLDTGKMSSFGSALTDLGKAGIDGFIKAFTDSESRIEKTAVNMLTDFIRGIDSRKTNLLNTFKTLVRTIITSFNSQRTLFVKVGQNWINQLLYSVKTYDNYKKFHSAGRYLVDGFAAGISANTYKAEAKSVAMAQAALKAAKEELGINSPATEGIEIGKFFDEGVAVGIEKFGKRILDSVSYVTGSLTTKMSEGITSDMTAEQAASKKAQNIVDAYQEGYDQLDLDDSTLDLEMQVYGGDEALVYAQKRARQLERINLARSKYDKTLSEVGENAKETQEAYNALLQEHIDLQTLDKTEQERLKAIEDEKYQHSLDWIESKKEANELSLFEELSAYKRVQSRYAEGTEKRIAMDKEVARVQKEIADASESYYKEVEQIHEDYTERKKELDKEYNATVMAYNDQLEADIKDVWATYEDAVKSRSKSIYNAFGLFDKVDTSEAVDGTTLIDNLQGQVDAIEDWKKDIQSLSKKGLADGLIEELQEMGPDSAAQIKALNSLSRTELNKYEKLWKEKQSSAREQAKFELTGLRLDSLAQVRKLELETDHALNQYRANWGTQMNQLKTDTDKQLEDAKTTWLETLKVSDPEKADLKSEFTNLVVEITNEVGNNMGWSLAGENAVAGIIQGINLNSHLLTSTVSNMMLGVLNSAYATWGIHSPSREFMKIGKLGIMGLAQGFANNAKLAMTVVKDVGNEALSGMSDSISRIVDLINGDIDTQPTIRPVLDLSDVESKAGRLNAMFSREQAMTINSSRSKVKSEENQNGSSSSPNNPTYNFTQNNYSPKALSKTDIYRQTKNQFSAMKRMVKA